MGGEKLAPPCAYAKIGGSPPHGRGKGEPFMLLPLPPRITPAWAGKRCTRHDGSRDEKDHPRMGGEKTVCPFW